MSTASVARPVLSAMDVERAPFLVLWESTRACDLACLHCRASALPRRDPRELRTDEVMRVMDEVRAMGQPLFIITGGDPLRRPDILPIVEHGARIGLRTALTPSGTPLMTPELLEQLRDAGLARLAVSLDGSTAAIHDAFRGVAGSFDWTTAMLREAHGLGLQRQVHTTIGSHNRDDWERLVPFLEEIDVALWSLFFVVPTGRARAGDLIGAEETERVLHRLYDISTRVSFDIKTTAAPQYRRVVLQRRAAEKRGRRSLPGAGRPAAPVTGRQPVGFTLRDAIGRAQGITDGRGMMFINHVGDVYPSGFLPVSAGNVREVPLERIYRESALFEALRDADRLAGKCGACEFRRVCGGSRARAYAMLGHWLEEDPMCAYVPRGYRASTEVPWHR